MQDQAQNRTSKSASKVTAAVSAFKHVSKPVSNAAMQAATYYERVSKPTGKAAMQTATYERTSKPTGNAATQKLASNHTSMQELTYDRTSAKEPASDQEHFGGLLDDDDTLEKEAAMSSPLKGSDLRAAAKVCPHNIIDMHAHFCSSSRSRKPSRIRGHQF